MIAQYNRLGLHVGESNIALIKRALRTMVRKNARYSRVYRGSRHVWLRALLLEHAEARVVYSQAMGRG